MIFRSRDTSTARILVRVLSCVIFCGAYFNCTHPLGNNHLIIFGGMAIQPRSDNPEDLCVLNDVRLFDLSTYRWLPASATSGELSPSAFIPKARYAHLSSVTSNRLFIIGGQDLNNVWLDDIHVYDLVKRSWIQRRDYPRHCGTYRSVAVTADTRVRIPQDEHRSAQSAKLGPPGTRFKTDKNSPPSSDTTSPDSLIHLPYSAAPTEEYPCDIYLFSNYNVSLPSSSLMQRGALIAHHVYIHRHASLL